MFVTRWEPFVGMNRLQREMDQLFSDLGFRASRSEQNSFPALSLSEDEENYYVEAELPGLMLDDLELQIAEGNQLSIQGERKKPQLDGADLHRQERGFGKFDRTVALPSGVDPEKVSATLSDGVLTVSLAKVEAAQTRKITVNAK